LHEPPTKEIVLTALHSAPEADADNEMIVDGVLSFARRYVQPLWEKHSDVLEDPRKAYEEDGSPSGAVVDLRRRTRMAAAEAGYYTLFAPAELGGGAQGATVSFLLYEALFREFGPGRTLLEDVVGKWNRGPSGLISHFSDALRADLSDDLMSGRKTFCFALSEPDAGSDAWALKTRAVRVDGGWRINGVKQWISDSPYADYALVFAVTDDELRGRREGGISAFFVPMDDPGAQVSSVIKLFGEIGGSRAILNFDDVVVPDSAVVGLLDHGLDIARSGVSLGRMHNAGRAVGTAQWALAQAVEYSQVRKTFGKLISSHQAIQFKLADSAMEIYAGHTMALDCARRIDAGKKVDKQLAMVKAYTCDMSFEVLDRCIQIHGGMGLTNDARLVDGWHSQRVSRLADGSAEIMRRNVARALLRGDLGI
jgi:acyl-CoA dehydrogenase